MSDTLKKAALIIGVAALAVTGIGLLVSPAAFGALAGVSAAASAIGLPTLFAIGVAGVSLGTRPSLEIESTGANARGQVYIDPNGVGAFVFGTTTVPMAIVYEELHGVNEDRISNIIAHAWHEIEGYVSLSVEGEVITFSSGVSTGAWNDIIEWRTNLGAPGQVALEVPDLAGGEFNWPDTATFAGVAHSAMTWNFFEDPEGNRLTSGVPVHVDILTEAALLYDPREDDDYGSGTHEFDDTTTWTFNDGNAALVALRFLIGERTPSGDLIWGRGVLETELHMDTFTAMADVADETLDDKPRYRIGGMHLLDGDFEGFALRWEEETGGKIYKSGGRYGIWLPHDDLTPITTITDDDLLAGAQIGHAVASDIGSLYNCARGRYIEPAQGYKAFPYPEVKEDTAIAEDGTKRPLAQDFSWVQDLSIAQRIARYKIRRSRFHRIWTVPIGWKGQGPNYRPFTVHTLNTKETGNQDQLCRVIDRRSSYNGPTVLIVQQEDPAIYDDTLPLIDPLAADTIPNRLGRLGTVTPRYIDGSALQPQGYVSDPSFSRKSSLWTIASSDAGRFAYHWGTNKPNSAEIVVGAGLDGSNALRLHEHDAVGTATVRTIGRPGNNEFVNNQKVQVSVRLRKRDSGTLGFGHLEFRVSVMSPDSSSATTDTGVLFDVSAINGWTIDEWVQAVAQVDVSEDFVSGQPFIGLDIQWEFDDGSVPMRVDIDHSNLVVVGVP